MILIRSKYFSKEDKDRVSPDYREDKYWDGRNAEYMENPFMVIPTFAVGISTPHILENHGFAGLVGACAGATGANGLSYLAYKAYMNKKDKEKKNKKSK